jgi:hypothetical protein
LTQLISVNLLIPFEYKTSANLSVSAVFFTAKAAKNHRKVRRDNKVQKENLGKYQDSISQESSLLEKEMKYAGN